MNTPPAVKTHLPPIADRSVSRNLWTRFRRVLNILLLLFGLFVVLNLDSLSGAHPELPAGSERLSYALLFVAGLFTSFHCVGMCGALVVGYTAKAAADSGSRYLTHLYYGAGKTLSYTVIGGMFGALGAIVSFTPFMRGMAGIGAGIFLLLFGLATLRVFPSLNRFGIKTPAWLMKRLGAAYRENSNPFVIGLLNGLMIICGPLQAMYIMAAGTGRPSEGAKLLFVFGLGTLPVMLGFGLLTSALSKQFAPKIMKASGLIVISLGAIMLNRGLGMVGSGYDFASLVAHRPANEAHGMHGGHGEHSGTAAPGVAQQIRMTVSRLGYQPNQFTLTKGQPVRWIVDLREFGYCTHRITVPGLGLEFDLRQGENVIEFTPERAGTVPWSCWTGESQGLFLIHDPPNAAKLPEMQTGHDHGHDHGGAPNPPVQWLKELLSKSAANIESLRRNLRP